VIRNVGDESGWGGGGGGEGEGEGGGRTSAFKQIGSLLAGSTIDGDRMMCLTKYVTVRAYQRENRTFMMVSRWFASPQSAARLSAVNARVRVRVRVLYTCFMLTSASLHVQAHRCFPDVASIAKLKFQHQQ
jgi:hypothetical protein